MQDFSSILDTLIIALSTTLFSLMALDFVVGLIQLWKKTEFTVRKSFPNQPPLEVLQPQPITPSVNLPQLQSGVAFFRAIESISPELTQQKKGCHSLNVTASNPTTLENLLTKINLDKIPLPLLRKIAGRLTKLAKQLNQPELAIAQKVNGKKQRVTWLREQLRKRLEQAPEIVAPVLRELATQQS